MRQRAGGRGEGRGGEGDTHSFRVVNKGVRLVVAKADVDQVLHPILPLFLAHVALEREQNEPHSFTEPPGVNV